MAKKHPFVHLHTHSHYSLLDGLSKIPELVKQTKRLGMTAVALTDHGNMHGAIEFYKTCKENDIKPIIGVEAYMAIRSRHDKESGVDNKRFHLTLLAKNSVGYKNLMKLVSKSFLEGYYYKPRMDKELLAEYSEGIICLTGCPGSEFVHNLREKKYDEAKELLQYYIDTFGKDHVFLEVMKHAEASWHDSHAPILEKIKELATEFDLPLVATWDSHYLHPEDKDAHDTLLKINTNNENFKLDGDYSFISPKMAHEIYADFPDACLNTQKIADMVDIEIDTDTWYFPEFPIPAGSNHDDILREQAYEGLAYRGVEKTPEVVTRIDYELDVIKMKGYASYFLCVADFINYATSVGIYSNTRGSAAGSMVSYLIGITNIDPIKYDLIFERFLNPERPSLPDVDMDFADDRRDEIIEYARRKYGVDAVAQIGTFGKMLARGVVRDVARAMEYPYSVGDRISKMIPMGSQGFSMTIKRAMDLEPDLKEAYDNERDVGEIIDMAKKIEGCVRHVSVHAAGVVISPTGRVDDFSPVQYDPKGDVIITQYDMYTGNREGIINLPKFDFLGLRNLTIMADAIKRVKVIRNIDIDIERIPDDDTKTFELLSQGMALGVFQFASSGMQKWLRELKPSNLDDLIAMVALYRPGPMAFIPDYIERKYNPEKVRYLDPRLEPILKRTYGIIIYQEDILIIATELAGYSWLEADKFRKAVGKKIPEEMEKQHHKFIDGCVTNGMKDTVAKELWQMIETFAAYGFNKAHAASYGQLAYRTAYMKANYPHEYMSAIMTAESGNIEKVAEVIAECAKMGFKVMPPDINESFSDFTVVVDEHGNVTNNIRFGLRNIKNFGEEIGKAIITERKERGKFVSIEDFLERVKHRNLTKKSLEALIQGGAMDEFGERGNLLANIEEMLTFNRELNQHNENQNSLFATIETPKARLILQTVEPATQDEKLGWEKELLGLYVSGHPLDKHREVIEKSGKSIAKLEHALKGTTLTIAGVIEDIKEIMTRKGDKMAFVRISDFTGSIECVIFPKRSRNIVQRSKLICVSSLKLRILIVKESKV
ncbi:MAG: DNA polymerase III subunit alpha [Candidatus Pacebacteria bacterium]|nr:DNA polymerase III subunit alpha [Candidatus Paceibacterota bacterium]